MLTDAEIKEAVEQGLDLQIEPFDPSGLQPASYDFHVGDQGFTSTSQSRIELQDKGILRIEPGEFAVVQTKERVSCSPSVAGQLGLRSEFARLGLLLLSGPQIDPGFEGLLVVRLVNLSPRTISLAHETPFLTAQFFKLRTPVKKPYAGSRQGQEGISNRDVQELTDTEGLTLGSMLKVMTTLQQDVSALKESVAGLGGFVKTAMWIVGILVTLGIAVISVQIGLQ